METIHIALAFDEKYALYGGATIASVLASAAPEDRFEFHILNNGLSISIRERLQKLVEFKGAKIQFLILDLNRYASLPKTVHTDAMYARLALPELLPKLDRILYLDSDVIVLKPLRPLWETISAEKLCCAVQDAADVFKGPFLDHKDKIGLARTTDYFNSGVLLINLAGWRKRDVAGQVIWFLEQFGAAVVFPDQDALNAVLKDQIVFLDPKWNVQTSLIRAVQYGSVNLPEWIVAVRDPAIIHYIGSGKPWVFHCIVPRRRDYHRFARLVAGQERRNPPTLREITQRICAEAIEFRHWLAALVKGRLRRI